MHWIDWLIILVPILIVVFNGLRAQKYVKGVSDFLTGGRVAGRYVLAVAQGEAAYGLVSTVAMFEVIYQSGFAYGFWGGFAMPLGVIMSLTGYCVYRFRETRAMTMGQFLEIRYSRRFRIFAAILQSISGIVNYALFPAVGARFLVYFCDLPLEVTILGGVFPTFALIMMGFLSLAVIVATLGGQVTIMVTDCVQGLLSYPLYLVVAAYLLWRFSWFDEIAPTLLDRPPGKSLLNPFDIEGLRDFNVFYIVVGMLGSLLNRMGWSGTQGYNAAAATAHEQKKGGVLGTWRTGFNSLMYILVAVIAFAFLNNVKFKDGRDGSAACRNELALIAMADVAADAEFDDIRREYERYIATGEISDGLQARIDEVKTTELAEAKQREGAKEETEEADEIAAEDAEPMLTMGKDMLKTVSKSKAQTFGTIFGQMRIPVALRYILPAGIAGSFCALCIFFMISTDTTYLHSWGSIIVQDLILPLRGRPFTPKQQLRLLRILIAGVAVFAFFFSFFFGQVDYILMFFAITGAIWLGGSGPCIVGGLYWKRGTTAGAWAALISGSSLALGGIIVQKTWVSTLYPWLLELGMIDTVTRVIEGISRPFEPFIEWRVTADKFPINSQEMWAANMFISLGLYIVVSLLTCREPFNMDRMLHRGKYQREGRRIERKRLTLKNTLLQLLGINEEYSRGDKILTWSVFIYTFGWHFVVVFAMVAIWNIISPWSNKAWANWFCFNNIILSGIIGAVSTVWFSIGTTWDLRRLFQRLKEKETNILDDGRVIGNVSADDVALVEAVDNTEIEKAHKEEEILQQALEADHDDADIENLHRHQKKTDNEQEDKG